MAGIDLVVAPMAVMFKILVAEQVGCWKVGGCFIDPADYELTTMIHNCCVWGGRSLIVGAASCEIAGPFVSLYPCDMYQPSCQPAEGYSLRNSAATPQGG